MFTEHHFTEDEPIFGYRWWVLTEEGDLLGGKVPELWKPGTSVASCAFGREHEAPQLDCECGLHGRDSAMEVITSANFEPNLVVGQVAGWGRVVVGDHWKAQYAKPVRLMEYVMPTRPAFLKAVEKYGAVV